MLVSIMSVRRICASISFVTPFTAPPTSAKRRSSLDCVISPLLTFCSRRENSASRNFSLRRIIFPTLSCMVDSCACNLASNMSSSPRTTPTMAIDACAALCPSAPSSAASASLAALLAARGLDGTSLSAVVGGCGRGALWERCSSKPPRSSSCRILRPKLKVDLIPWRAGLLPVDVSCSSHTAKAEGASAIGAWSRSGEVPGVDDVTARLSLSRQDLNATNICSADISAAPLPPGEWCVVIAGTQSFAN
mmetsp:Transcript_38224/g.89706  ORF Transcript_38224/g.89706 Transcript_38224/m.89706 type:complete len:249 (-) Transcript_38224:8-754(-)